MATPTAYALLLPSHLPPPSLRFPPRPATSLPRASGGSRSLCALAARACRRRRQRLPRRRRSPRSRTSRLRSGCSSRRTRTTPSRPRWSPRTLISTG
ncbi:hypothetical protein PVAP13_3NG178914 [Panicum virgatum]|uniref:Uncharacterized protein n=1 Tax=Panicum virgatum TaxID=38727 RepID=A0A8T0U4F0_PANVG|nr:hypothetical protein PVAP13_3NG178914 [Panicum virgatum]